jgi:hypothetical protein
MKIWKALSKEVRWLSRLEATDPAQQVDPHLSRSLGLK